MATSDISKGFMVHTVVVLTVCFVFVAAQSVSPTPPAPVTTTPAVAEVCASLNASCGDCVSHAQCLWCPSNSIGCIPYPVGQVIPHSDYCDLSIARWGVCWLNYKAMLIAMGCIAGVLLISLVCCVYCCCCRSKGNKKKYEREDAKYEREKEERQQRHSEKKAERQSKYDDIRKKYGIGQFSSKEEGLGSQEGSSKYQRFDNEDA